MNPINGNSPHAEAAVDDPEARRPIGEIFVELGFITAAELDAAFAEQVRTGARLGEILVEQGSLTRLDLATALADHWERHSDPQKGDAGLNPIGSGATTPEISIESDGSELRFDEAAAAQARISAAEAAVSELAARLERIEGRAVPEAVPPLTPTEVRLRRPLGQILVERGFISKQQLETALASQARSGARIGEILLEQGILTDLDLESALGEQASPPQTSDASSRTAAGPAVSLDNSPVIRAPAQGWSEEDRAVIAQLEERLRAHRTCSRWNGMGRGSRQRDARSSRRDR